MSADDQQPMEARGPLKTLGKLEAFFERQAENLEELTGFAIILTRAIRKTWVFRWLTKE